MARSLHKNIPLYAMRIFPSKVDVSVVIAVAAAVLLMAQMLFLSEQFDAYSLLRDRDIKIWQIPFAYLGDAAKLFLLTASIYLLINRAEIFGFFKKSVVNIKASRFLTIIAVQILSFAILLILTNDIFSDHQTSHRVGFISYFLWVVFAAAVFVLWLSSLFPGSWFIKHIVIESKSLSVSSVLGVFILVIALAGRNLWVYLADATFAVSKFFLALFVNAAIYSIPQERVLGVGDFAVSISSACSGYEGIGLIVGFTAIYLFINRDKFKFPQAILLFPIGVLLIWLLNCIRIALLIVIGYRWSPDIAVGGFHSHAGWIAFILVSMFILFMAGRCGFWLKATEVSSLVEKAASAPLGIITPFVALMASTLLTSAVSSGFDYAYPIRVFAVGAVLVMGWSHLGASGYKFRLEPIVGAIAVSILWILISGKNDEADHLFVKGLASMPFALSSAWLIFRAIGSILTVPIAEELAFRGYLLCKLSNSDSFVRGKVPLSVAPIVLSSIAFGLLHATWVAGIIAGLIFSLVRVRSLHIGDAVLCHMTANLIIFTYAAVTGNWFVV